MESHYCRNTESYRNKRFLYTGTSVTYIYKDYCDANIYAFRVFDFFSSHVSLLKPQCIFVPRKDQCELCIRSNLGTLSEESQRKHIHDKNVAREQKNKDKAEADGDETKSFWTMDLQSVLLCPKSNASSLYFKTKVHVHNMTYHNGNTKEGYCYMWDECNGDLSSNMFAYLDYHHFEQYIKSHPNITHYIIWSDNCSYQNKNVTLSNMFFHLVRTYNVTIDQKYLLTGHTQMECDSMHSYIEKHCNLYKSDQNK